jgi:hypothetical protein
MRAIVSTGSPVASVSIWSQSVALLASTAIAGSVS